MELSQSLSDEQLALERVADRLLETFPPDSDRPAYTERQLARHGNRIVLVSLYSLSEKIVAEPQEFRDELRFLMSVTRLQPEQRRCLRLWVDGWNQWEIAEAYGVPQTTISYRIRRALRACYDSAPLSFRRFSYHSVYRKPRKTHDYAILRRCIHCEDEYSLGIGLGRYCSLRCRETARHFGQEKSSRRIDSRG